MAEFNQRFGTEEACFRNRLSRIQSCKTAWTWLHKLRRAMVRPGRERLSGHVAMDETFVGGLEEGVSSRQTAKKALVANAEEYPQGRLGRVRMARQQNRALLSTPTAEGYTSLEKLGYRHKMQ